MKYLVAVLVTVAVGLAALFAFFKLTAGRVVATSPGQLGGAPAAPPSAVPGKDKTAQRIDAVSGLVGAAGGLLGKVF